MKYFILLALFFNTAHAFDILVGPHERFKSSEVIVEISTKGCEEIELDTDELSRQWTQSIKRYWGAVADVGVKFVEGDHTDMDVSMARDSREALSYVELGKILIACNTDHFQFMNNPGLGMRSSLICENGDCSGVILINANSDSMVKDYSDQQFQGYLAHSLGSLIGIAGSRDRRSIMYPYIFRVYPETLSMDDIAAIRFLYPKP